MHVGNFIVFASALCVRSSSAQCPPQEVAGLIAPGNQPWEYFGETVATSGDTTLVGCDGYGSTAPQVAGPGAVFVYTRDPLDAHGWTLTHTIPAPPDFTVFGWTVALDGDTAAIACGAIDYPWSYVVHVHERNAGGPDAWGYVATLHNDYFPNGNADHFGRGLVVDGGRIAVGAPQWGTTTYGSVYVFERDAGGPGAWGLRKRILNPNTTFLFDDFGRGLALDGETLVVGAERAAAENGRAYVYERDFGGPDAWGLVQTLNPQLSGQVHGGSAVAVDGDWLCMGIRAATATAIGRVRVFQRTAGTWNSAQLLAPSVVSNYAGFGSSLALDRGKLAVGALGDTSTPGKQGSVFVFEDLGVGAPNWTESARLQASDGQPAFDQFGTDVELWHAQLVVGNTRNGTGTQLAGKVHVFDLESPAPPLSYCTAGTSSNGCSATLHGVGTPSASNVDGFELVAVGLDGGRSAAIFYGVSGPLAIPVPGTASWRCVHAPLQRTGIVDAGGTAGACDGSVRIDWNSFRTTHPAALGAPFGAGQTVWAQAWNRDALLPTGLPATQGLEFTLCP